MNDILTMSSRDIRRRSRELTPVLWGSTRIRHRQYGSPEDRRLYAIETANWKRLAEATVQIGQVLQRRMVTAAEAAKGLAAAAAAYGGGSTR